MKVLESKFMSFPFNDLVAFKQTSSTEMRTISEQGRHRLSSAWPFELHWLYTPYCVPFIHWRKMRQTPDPIFRPSMHQASILKPQASGSSRSTGIKSRPRVSIQPISNPVNSLDCSYSHPWLHSKSLKHNGVCLNCKEIQWPSCSCGYHALCWPLKGPRCSGVPRGVFLSDVGEIQPFIDKHPASQASSSVSLQPSQIPSLISVHGSQQAK
jgi:hypothetical protein